MGGIIMATINSNGTMVFGNSAGGSVTIAPKNNTSTNYTLSIPDTSGTLALVDSPALTGTPTAPTAPAGTNSTQIATTAMVHSAITNDLHVTGSAPMFACRAWVNFDGTASSPTPRASGNISSITKNGTGKYTINLTAAMPDTNAALVASLRYANDTTSNNYDFISPVFANTSAIDLFSDGANGNSEDAALIYLAVFR
jgi:hypothetical protein